MITTLTLCPTRGPVWRFREQVRARSQAEHLQQRLAWTRLQRTAQLEQTRPAER